MPSIDAASAASATTNQSSNLTLQDFMKILLTQLSYQDPLKPMDNQEFMAQVAQFTTLQQSQQLNQKIDQLLSIQAATQSIGLIGKTVDVNGQSGPVSGVVTALSFSTGAPQLTIRTDAGELVSGVTLTQVVSVH
jgi:flagellar basal-body rod modification protein FlgD